MATTLFEPLVFPVWYINFLACIQWKRANYLNILYTSTTPCSAMQNSTVKCMIARFSYKGFEYGWGASMRRWVRRHCDFIRKSHVKGFQKPMNAKLRIAPLSDYDLFAFWCLGICLQQHFFLSQYFYPMLSSYLSMHRQAMPIDVVCWFHILALPQSKFSRYFAAFPAMLFSMPQNYIQAKRI